MVVRSVVKASQPDSTESRKDLSGHLQMRQVCLVSEDRNTLVLT